MSQIILPFVLQVDLKKMLDLQIHVLHPTLPVTVIGWMIQFIVMMTQR